MALAAMLGFINSRILLSIIYYGLILPIGLALRTAGHDPLMRRGKAQASYWVRRNGSRQTREQFERAF
jgi:hypothetical protein